MTKALTVLAIIAAMICLQAGIIYLAWNVLVVFVFGVSTITYSVAIAAVLLLALVKALIGGLSS